MVAAESTTSEDRNVPAAPFPSERYQLELKRTRERCLEILWLPGDDGNWGRAELNRQKPWLTPLLLPVDSINSKRFRLSLLSTSLFFSRVRPLPVDDRAFFEPQQYQLCSMEPVSAEGILNGV